MAIDATYHQASSKAAFVLRTAAVLTALFVASPSLAEDPKPDAAIKNRNIEARVLLDAQIKADPALAADRL